MQNSRKTENRITVRLSQEAYEKCQEAKQLGYSTTDFVTQAILGVQSTKISDQTKRREVLKHFCQAQIIVQNVKDSTLKKELREELDTICQFLK